MANTIEINTAILKGYNYILELSTELTSDLNIGDYDCETADKIERILVLSETLQELLNDNILGAATDALYLQLLNAIDDYTGAGGTLDPNLEVTNTVIGGSAQVTWGGIQGVITEQTDLIVLLSSKVDKVIGSSLITDASITRLANTSGNNTGDETTLTIQSKRPLKTIEGLSLEGFGNINLGKADVGLGNVPNTDFTAAVAANTAKTGITTAQADAILANTAKVGITTAQASEITANTAKVGITTAQANAIVSNTTKETNATHTGDASGATVLTLSTVNSNIGTFGSNANIPVVTVNAKGLVTAISTQAVSIPSGAINVTSSDITMSGTTGTAITNAVISNNVVTNAKLAQVPTKTFKGRTSASTGNVEDLTISQVKSDLSINNVDNTSDVNKPISTATQTALNLKADLVGGFVPANQLPSYVDDVLEFATLVNFPTTGESGKIYITEDTSKVYRWSGSTYIEISGGASATVSARTVSTFTATALQTTFSLPLGYVAGLVDVFLNGVKLTGSEFVATNGITIVLNEGAALGDIIDIHNFNTAFTANNTLRLVNTFTTTAGQTTFSLVYTAGLIDVFYNGSRLTASEYTASNGTSVVLATPSVLNDIVEILVYNFNVSGFSGLGGTGTVNTLPKFTSENSIGNSSIVDNGSTVSFGLPITATGATFSGTVAGITKAMVGLGNVDNTSDINKPISTATQTGLNLKANLNNPTFTGTVLGITPNMIGLGDVNNTTDGNKPVSIAQADALNLKINTTQKGVVNGVVPLDSGAKILSTYFPDSILGNLKFGGTYNGSVITASASFSELQGLNLPTTGYLGIYFITTTAFTRASVTYDIGDWVLHNGNNNYVKVDNTDAVTTVFGRLGNILANSSDYSDFYSALGHVHAIADITGLQSDLNAKLNLTGGTLTGAVTAPSSNIGGLETSSEQVLTILAGTERWVQIATFQSKFSAQIQIETTAASSEEAAVIDLLGTYFANLTTINVRRQTYTEPRLLEVRATGVAGEPQTVFVRLRANEGNSTLRFRIVSSRGLISISNTVVSTPAAGASWTSNLFNVTSTNSNLSGTSASFSGNVGIGTNNPTVRLDVVGNGKFSGTGTFGGDILLTGIGRGISFNGLETQIYESAGSLRIYTNTLDRLVVLQNGNVGIGTTNPVFKLEVNGAFLIGDGFNNTGDYFGIIGITKTGNGILTVNVAKKGVASGVLSLMNEGGNVGIGNLSFANTRLTVSGADNGSSSFAFVANNSSNNNLFLVRNDGQATFTGSVTASSYITSSDMRLKDLVTPYDYKQVANLNPITYKWKDGSDDLNHYGYSAQEVEKYMPQAVYYNDKGFMSVNYTEVLVAKMFAVEEKGDERDVKIAHLEARVKELENKKIN